MTPRELLDLLVRWVHLIAGIMWIGNSMLFNWLDRNLEKAPERAREPGYEGKLWMVHSGGFYEVEKKQLEPGQLPARLHWFKWQNFTAWASGIGLLVIVYYANGGAFLIDPSVRALGFGEAVALSGGTLFVGWLTYDVLWRTLGPRAPLVAGVGSLVMLVALTFGLTQVFSGRAAYLHVGVLLGTVMTGNVWTVIIPSQRKLVAATRDGQPQDYALNLKAKQRSIHNNYMTFPLLFIMLSTHFPSTYGSAANWVVLLTVSAGGALVRHFMNIRFGKPTVAWLGPIVAVVVLSVVALVGLTARPAPAAPVVGSTVERVKFSQVQRIVKERCVSCHATAPTEPMFPQPPNGVVLETPQQVQALAARIKDRVVVSKTMPFINKTGMADDERGLVGRWVDEGANLNE